MTQRTIANDARTVLDNAVLNCIMLFTHYQHLEQEGVPFGLELVLRGSVERVRPMVLLGLSAGMALVPLLIADNIPLLPTRTLDSPARATVAACAYRHEERAILYRGRPFERLGR